MNATTSTPSESITPTGIRMAGAGKSILLITPENPEINRVRRRQFNNFTQITMPYLAGFIDEARYQIELVDEYNQRIPYERPADIVAITVNTPNAAHCYRMAARFRACGARVVMGGPHATLRPDEAAQHCDHLVVGEAEETWPQFLTSSIAVAPSRAILATARPPCAACRSRDAI